MTDANVTFRARQAQREIGATRLARPLAWALTLVFLATIGTVPLAEEWVRLRALRAGEATEPLALVGLPSALLEAGRVALDDGIVAGNRRLQRSIDDAESRLEDGSFLRAWLLPRVQGRLLAWLGLGNEQVYAGRDGWLFYRADIDHVVGPGFLEPRVQGRRLRGGDAWEAPPRPDPLPVLIDLERELGARGIDLIVMPTPVKPTVHPERFALRSPAPPEAVLRNASYGEFVDRLREAGLSLFDPTPILLGVAREDGATAYLRTDTHWTPAAMEKVAEALAARLVDAHDLGPEAPRYLERVAAVQADGDLTAMLRLPEGRELVAPERVRVRTVLDAAGASWRPVRQAPVLLLGDSFTNVFSDPRLGWGAAAGLAERLSFHLRRPLDRIAVNAGGAHASREALARDLGGARDRLTGTRVVVYQFAARELSQGDWREVVLAP